MSIVYTRMLRACHSYVTRMCLYLSLCTRMLFICHSYILYVIRMSLSSTRMSSVCHSYVLICHPYVIRMYSCVIRTSLVCTRKSSLCQSYVIRMSLVCGFTMNRIVDLQLKSCCKLISFNVGDRDNLWNLLKKLNQFSLRRWAKNLSV